MRLVLALIQTTKLKAVQEALANVGVERMTVCDALGYGQQRGGASGGTPTTRPHFRRKVALEIAVNEGFLDRTVKNNTHVPPTGRTGAVGDGKRFVLAIGGGVH